MSTYFSIKSNVILVIPILTSINCVFGKTLFDKTLTFDSFNGVIGAFGDFDFNRVTDVVIITENGRSLQLLNGYQWEPYFEKRPNIDCSFAKTSNEKIVGVIAADFTGGAHMDLLVVTVEETYSLKTDSHSFKLWLFRANQTNIECNTTVPLVQNIKSFPLALDFDGDMITDFIVETDYCRKELWNKLRPLCLEQFHTNQSMSYPNSNAFIDLSDPKDFRPDIFISGIDYMEYWFNIEEFDGKRNRILSYPDKIIYKFSGQSVFADINFDGIIEHIIPVCKSDVHTCDEPQILVSTNNGSNYEWVEVFDSNNENLTFIQSKLFGYLDLFVTLRVGDIDSDGYPDLVTVMRNKYSEQTKVVWMKNSKSKTNKFGRKFTIEWISDISHFYPRTPHLATIFDFGEDGKLDILVGSHDKNGTLYLDAFINNGKSSSNFLKVFVSAGICHSNCPRISTPLIGAHLCFSPSEAKEVSCAGQLSQTQHFALQLPFVVFGLGDIPNFVDNLSISIPSGKMPTRLQTWKEIIPDSRIVVIPYPANKTNYWIQKLYLDPKYFAFPTLITLTTICCILVVIIAILHKKDLRQDIIEHREYKKHWL